MRDIVSQAASPVHAPSLALRCVWDVTTWPGYHPTKQPEPHDYMIAIRTLRGRGRMALDRGEPIALPENTLFLIERNRIRSYRREKCGWRFWWFEFTVVGPLHTPVGVVLPVTACAEDLRTFRELFAMLRRRQTARRALASALFGVLLHRWTLHTGDQQPPSQRQVAMEAAIERMSAHLESDFPVPEMAAAAHMSVRSFCHAFYTETGQSPKSFFTQLRLGLARELLRHGAQNVTEVADRLGYANPFYFSRAFCREFGHPPSALRTRTPRRPTTGHSAQAS